MAKTSLRVFQHYKGGRYLLLDDNVLHTETEERMVAYGSLDGDPKTFVRPHAMFFGSLEDGRRRFVEVDEMVGALIGSVGVAVEKADRAMRGRALAAGFALGMLAMYLIAAAALLYRWSSVYGVPSFNAAWQTVVFWLYWTLHVGG